MPFTVHYKGTRATFAPPLEYSTAGVQQAIVAKFGLSLDAGTFSLNRHLTDEVGFFHAGSLEGGDWDLAVISRELALLCSSRSMMAFQLPVRVLSLRSYSWSGTSSESKTPVS